MNTTYEFHEVAAIFPLLPENELQDLAADIKAHGQKNPIWIHENKIVDGRNRYKGCLIAGVEPRFEEWDGVGLLTDFVWSLNALRRQMDDGQRAMSAARYAVAKEEESRARELANLRNHSSVESIDSTEGKGRSRDDAAEKFKTSSKTVQRATTVLKNGTDELVAAVESGAVAVSAAADIASLSKEEQAEAIKGGKDAIKEATRRARERKLLPQGAAIIHDTLPSGGKSSKKKAPDESGLTDEEWLEKRAVYRVLRGKQHGGIVARRALLDYRKAEKAITAYARSIASAESVKAGDANFFAKAFAAPRTITSPDNWGVCAPCAGAGCKRCDNAGFEMSGGIDPRRIEAGEVDR